MRIQNTNAQTNYTGRAFIVDSLWGEEAKTVKKAIKQINQMRIVKNAPFDILIEKNRPQLLTVCAQKRSDYCRKPVKFALRTYEITVAHPDALVSAVKRVIPRYKKRILPIIEQPDKYKPKLKYDNGTIVAEPELISSKFESLYRKIINFGKKVLKKF